jgi:hypothetical protein
VEGTPYSQEYVSLLARTVCIEAIKRGRSWYTTRRALDDDRELTSKKTISGGGL